MANQDAGITEKRCNTCLLVLPVDRFYRSKKGDGYEYRCKDCTKASLAAFNTPEATRGRAAKWRARHPERAKQIGRDYYWRDPERGRRLAQVWRDANPDRVIEGRRRWYEANDGAKRQAERRRADPVGAKATNSRANWKRRHAPAARLREAEFRLLLNDPCAYCGCTSDTIDHIVPVSLGGLSEWGNLAAACKSCNSSKKEKSLLNFLLYQRVVTAHA